jgi:hypothetical protein
LWSFLCLVLRVFFNSPTNFHLWKQGLSDVLLCGFLSLCLVLEYFSTVLPNSLPMKVGLSDVLLFVIPFTCLVKSIFQQSYLPTWKQDWVMCCSFVIPLVWS